jgi:isoleucyl-tRNA synthetase
MELDKYDPRTQTLDKYERDLKIEDKWIISRVNSMMKKFIGYMKEYELHRATRELLNFLVEDVSRTYIRLVRPRVWIEESNDKYVVYSTLYYVLIRSLKLLSTIAPHYSEEIWQKFFKHFNPRIEESIHLSRIEEIEDSRIDEELEEDMRKTLEIVSAIAAARNRAGIKLRWPVRVAYIMGDSKYLKGLERCKEVAKFLSNTKDIQPVDSFGTISEDVELEIYETDNFTIAIPKKLDKELFYEAIARELIRRIQVMRNELDLNVDEYIEVGIKSDSEDILKTIELHEDYILNEVRGNSLFTDLIRDGYTKNWNIEKYRVLISIKKYRSD